MIERAELMFTSPPWAHPRPDLERSDVPKHGPKIPAPTLPVSNDFRIAANTLALTGRR